MKTTIKSIATGSVKSYDIKNNIFESAYKKDTFLDSCNITCLGLQNDFQVDRKFHGGIDKAIHIGSTKHFKTFLDIHNQELDPLAIGCNILIDNYDENDVCIGDIYTIGSVEIEVTQPRQPCWKIGALFGKEVSRFIIKHSATGWYVRILKEGTIDISNKMILKKRVSNITINQLTTYLNTPPMEDKEIIDTILQNPTLAVSYKDDFQALLVNGSKKVK